MQKQELLVNGERLQYTIEKFANFGRTKNNGVTRLSLSNEDVRVRNYFCECCKELGMSIRFDDLGNIYATLEGTENKPAIVIGSHLDTVKEGGRFDGVLGVIAGLEVIQTLVENKIQPSSPITIMNFTNEEGARFEPSMMASGVLAGKFDLETMMSKRDLEGTSFREALIASGYNGDFKNRITDAAAYLELHIEQGPVLEKEGLTIGVVDCVVGMVCYEITVNGESNHAGTTPMELRRDAFVDAVNLISDLHKQLSTVDQELVYTVGRFNVFPNIHTVIPNKVVFTIEARHKSEDVIRQVEDIITKSTYSQTDYGIEFNKLWGRDTVLFNQELCERIEASVKALGYSNRKMVSGAGHDAQFVAAFIPSAMIFVPSKKGKSHCEEEYTSYGECEKGVNVLLQAVLSMI